MSTKRPQKIVSRFVLPGLAAGAFVFAVVAVIQPGRTRADPPARPPSAPFAATVAGIGTIEPESELIAIATELPGVVRTVHVRPGERVEAGRPLFTLDRRAAEAALDAARAEAASAAAAVRVAEAAVADERQRLGLFERVDDPQAVSDDELQRRRFAVRRAEAAAAQARASAQAAEAQARARATDLARLTVASPIAGRVFRVDVRPGEYAAAGPSAQPLLTLGADGRLHVRAEFDEADAPRLRDGAKAYGTLRGAAERRVSLSFVRFEPQVTEKRALSGGSERVDTRVVEAIYSFDPAAAPASFLGQRMDVFVEAPRSATAAAPAAAGEGRP